MRVQFLKLGILCKLAGIATVCVLATIAHAEKPPPLLWSISDESLSEPLGAIADVAVGLDGTVFLLDTQNCAVRRLSGEGRELRSLGRRGEGPGEFMHPRLLAALPNGGCVVLQDFYASAVCFSGESNGLGLAPDLSAIRDRFRVILTGTARIDMRGRLVVSAITVDRSYRNAAGAVFRLSPPSNASMLMVEGKTLGEANTVHVPEQTGFYIMRCWDVDATGKLIFADPSNAYRVIIGHPADGESRTISLASHATDDENLRRLEKSAEWTTGEYPRIANLYWLDEGHFLVKPGAEARELVAFTLGVFEAFDDTGRSFGRHTLQCDFDPEQDSHFIRNGLLIVIKGGKSANDAVYAQMAAMLGMKRESSESGGDNLVDGIRVDVYDLNRHFMAASQTRN